MDVYIGLGSNLGDRLGYLGAGLEGLSGSGLPLIALSSVWETEPVEAQGSPWFLNMVAQTVSELPPLALLDRLLELEAAAGRRRGEPNEPRTLDLDLLLVGARALELPRLSLPHPRMWTRRFVLEPLAELAPTLRNPQSGLTVVEECRRAGQEFTVRKLCPAEDILRGRSPILRLGEPSTYNPPAGQERLPR